MAMFFIGEWVRVVPRPDPNCKHWTRKHSDFCNQVVEVKKVESSKNFPNIVFLCLRHPKGKQLVWFLDRHCVVEENYDNVFIANMQRAVDKLNRYEKVAKKCRDDILREVFTPEEYRAEEVEDWDQEFFDEWDDDMCEMKDDFEEDWEDVVTKPIVPLPGQKTNVQNIKGSKVIKNALKNSKKKQKATINTNSIDPADWMTDEELTDYLSELVGDDKIQTWGDPD